MTKENVDFPPIREGGFGGRGGGCLANSRFDCRFGSFAGGLLLTTTFRLGRFFNIPFSDFTTDLLAALGSFVLTSLIGCELQSPLLAQRRILVIFVDLSMSSIFSVFCLITSNP